MEPDEIRELLKELDPKVIIPMHYRSETFGYDVIGTLDGFLKSGRPGGNIRYQYADRLS